MPAHMYNTLALARFERYLDRVLKTHGCEDLERCTDVLVEQHLLPHSLEGNQMSDTAEKPMFKIYTQPSKNAALNVQIQKGSALDLPKKISFGTGNKRLKYTEWIQGSLGGDDDAQKRLNALAQIFEQGQEKGSIAILFYDKNLAWVPDVIAKFLTENKKTLEAVIPYLKQGMSMKEKSLDEMTPEERETFTGSRGNKTLADLPENDRDQISALLKEELGDSVPETPVTLPMSDETKHIVSLHDGLSPDEENNYGHVYSKSFVITPHLAMPCSVDLLDLARKMVREHIGEDGQEAIGLVSATVNSILAKVGTDEFYLERQTERVEEGIRDFDFAGELDTQVEFDNRMFLFGKEFSTDETMAIVDMRADCFVNTTVSASFGRDGRYTLSIKPDFIRLVAEDNKSTLITPTELVGFTTGLEVTGVSLELSLQYPEVDHGQAIADMLNAGSSNVVVSDTVVNPEDVVSSLATELSVTDNFSDEDIVAGPWDRYKENHPELKHCVEEHPNVANELKDRYFKEAHDASITVSALGKSHIPEDVVEKNWEQYKKEHSDVFATVVATPEQPQ